MSPLLTVLSEGWYPFSGLDPVYQALFTVAFVIIVGLFNWTAVLFVSGMRADRRPAEEGGEGNFDWIFLVPALNEEVTIRDSVERLEEIPLERKRIVVINDGSDDGTAEVLASMSNANLHVIERRPPNAKQGKAAALNFAFAEVNRWWPDLDPDRTIICVVDADGRIGPQSPRFIAGHFADELVGGVQSLVRIYNRHRLLTWFQDIEFSIYGRLFQSGRNGWGTPGMGGNGQYNRMSALASIDTTLDFEIAQERKGSAPDSNDGRPPSLGPWRDRLTEDQDLGLRLILAGWDMRHENRASVDQQGLSKMRPLVRQRTRWSQGNLQAMGLIPSILRSRVPLVPRSELVLYLLIPFLQGIVGVSLIAAIYLAFTGVRLYDDRWWMLLFVYLLGFGGTMLGCIAAKLEGRFSVMGFVKGLLTAQIYAFYSWVLWPVLLRSAFRQLSHRDSWAKTAREKIPS